MKKYLSLSQQKIMIKEINHLEQQIIGLYDKNKHKDFNIQKEIYKIQMLKQLLNKYKNVVN